MATTDVSPIPTIAARELQSRLLLGTGGFRSLEAMAAAIEASGAELVDGRAAPVDPGARGSIVEVLEGAGCGCCRTRPAASPRATRSSPRSSRARRSRPTG